jgi:hypothetical protein
MKRISTLATISLLSFSSLAFAQDQPNYPQQQPQVQQPPQQQVGPWRRLDSSQPPPSQPTTPADADLAQNQQPPAPNGNYAPPPQQQYPQQQNMNYGPPPPPVPAQLTIKPGTYVTIRVNQPLSSDHNQPGDAFSATLVRPIIVDGVVVAARGQTVGGRVAEAVKAGRVQGTSRLGVQLTDLELVDGQQVPFQSQLVSRSGGTSIGRDAGAIGGTTAVGAAVGAAAGWGKGAAIGAGAGAVLGTIGVLVTRGQATVIYPEQVLTFRVEAPVPISTERSTQAFRYVDPSDYEPQGGQMQMRAGPGGPPPANYAYGPSYYPANPYYPYGYYSPYYYGPSFAFGFGPGFYGRGYYYGGRGFYGGRGYVGHRR